MRRLIHLMLSPSCRLARLMVAEKRVACDPVHGRGCAQSHAGLHRHGRHPRRRRVGDPGSSGSPLSRPSAGARRRRRAPRGCLRWLDWAMGPFHEQVTQRIVYEKAGQRFTGAGLQPRPRHEHHPRRARGTETGAGGDRPGGGKQRQSGRAASAIAGRPGGGGASVGAGLFRRSAVERISRRRGMVCADEIAAQLPLHPGRPGAGPAAGARIMPNWISETEFSASRLSLAAARRRTLRLAADHAFEITPRPAQIAQLRAATSRAPPAHRRRRAAASAPHQCRSARAGNCLSARRALARSTSRSARRGDDCSAAFRSSIHLWPVLAHGLGAGQVGEQVGIAGADSVRADDRLCTAWAPSPASSQALPAWSKSCARKAESGTSRAAASASSLAPAWRSASVPPAPKPRNARPACRRPPWPIAWHRSGRGPGQCHWLPGSCDNARHHSRPMRVMTGSASAATA